MEQDLAILIADLSGYSAMTEIHGSFSAADMIDKYINIVNDSLVGDSFLHERVGDEVMILSPSPENLLRTAEILCKNLSEENHFLQIHAGLHYGQLLKRGNGFFGSALNIASRIASLAQPGTVCCSETFLRKLNPVSASNFKSIGQSSFKNISEPLEIFELDRAYIIDFHIDPVCRMIVFDHSKSFSHPTDPKKVFCSEECKQIYMANAALAH
jgi:class 3 adenylate cyclase/YHS domain-containing protein